MISPLPNHLIRRAFQSGRDRRSWRAQRADGWTPPRIRTFLEVLARTGAVAPAARAAGMSRQSAYALRASAKGQAFDDAWRSALLFAAPCVPDEIMERAMNGCVEPIFRGGKVWGEQHRFDNALSMRVLRDLDRVAQSKSPSARLIQALADDFEALVEIACTGDEEQFDAFLRSHDPARWRGGANLSNLSTLPADGQHQHGERQTPNRSTLPDTGEADRDEPPAPSDSPVEAPGSKSSNVSTLPAARSGVSRREARSIGFVTPSRRMAGRRHPAASPRLFAPADHFASGMKLYRVRSFFPPGRRKSGDFPMRRLITELRRR
jgi:hypothetical protein